MPQTSQTAKAPERTNPTNESRCRPSDVRPVLREHADDRRADEPAEHDQRHRDPVHGVVDVVGEVVEAGVPDLDLELPLPGLLHHVAHLVGQLARDAGELPDLGLRPERDPAR